MRLRGSKFFLDNSVMDTPRMPGGILRLVRSNGLPSCIYVYMPAIDRSLSLIAGAYFARCRGPGAVSVEESSFSNQESSFYNNGTQFVTGSARVHLFNASVTVELRTTSGNVLQLVTVCITIDEFFNLKYDGFQH